MKLHPGFINKTRAINSSYRIKSADRSGTFYAFSPLENRWNYVHLNMVIYAKLFVTERIINELKYMYKHGEGCEEKHSFVHPNGPKPQAR